MLKHIGQPLHVERGGEHCHHPRARRRDHLAHHEQQPETQHQRGEQVTICRHQSAVHDPLHEKRRDQRHHFQRHRKHQHLQRRAFEPRDTAHESGNRQLFRFRFLHEAIARRQLKRDAGEVFRELSELHATYAPRWIVQHHLVALDRRQHHKMIHVPMQNARQREFMQVLEIKPQRARRQAQSLRECNQVAKRCAFERQLEATTQFGEIGFVSVIARHHRERGEPTFSRFGLQNHRHARAESKIKLAQKSGVGECCGSHFYRPIYSCSVPSPWGRGLG